MDFSKIKKEISLFINSEEAKMLKKDVAKLGLTASVIAAIMMQAQEAQAYHQDGHESGHGDSHSDGDVHSGSHSDSHSDSSGHTDSHQDGHFEGHLDSHTSHNEMSHNSRAIYDETDKKGGHYSQMDSHGNY
ncbi:MAG: hypothetical protein JW867_06540 [Candidatus Omnitrophica bacterium]|nr:hypothetical protein [Candidatus Omnitrophota bacterium]